MHCFLNKYISVRKYPTSRQQPAERLPVTPKTMEKAKTQQRYKHNLLNEYLLHRNTTEKAKHRSIRIALIKKRECRELFLWNSALIYQFNTTKGTQEVSLESRTTRKHNIK